MAQTDPVPTAVRAPSTGATIKASTKRRPADWRRMGEDDPGFPRLWREICAEVEREYSPLGVATKDLTSGWYEAIIGRMPVGWHFVAVCYAAAAILLGWWPWNLLLLLLLFPIRNKRVRLYAFRTVAAAESMRWRESYRHRSRI